MQTFYVLFHRLESISSNFLANAIQVDILV